MYILGSFRYYPLQLNEVMRINGNLPELGFWEKDGPKVMSLTREELPIPMGGTGRMWEYVISLPNSISKITYKYTTINTITKLTVWEREPTREIKIPDTPEAVNEYFMSRLSMSAPEALSDANSLLMYPENGTLLRFDVNFVTAINFNKIGDYPIFIGAYPQHEQDILELKQAGVTAVISLQTSVDLKHRGIDWTVFESLYDKHGIKGVNFQIHDYNTEDLASKVKEAAKVLKALIDSGRQVYVHCTAGMGRAPTLVVAYLVMEAGMGVDAAIGFVKSHRVVANPNKGALVKAFEESK